MGATMAVQSGCAGNGCVILKAAIGTGFVFKGAIDATGGIPTVISERINQQMLKLHLDQ